MQDDNLYYVGTGSRTNYEQVILNYHWFDGRILNKIVDCLFGPPFDSPYIGNGIFTTAYFEQGNSYYTVCSRLLVVP